MLRNMGIPSPLNLLLPDSVGLIFDFGMIGWETVLLKIFSKFSEAFFLARVSERNNTAPLSEACSLSYNIIYVTLVYKISAHSHNRYLLHVIIKPYKSVVVTGKI